MDRLNNGLNWIATVIACAAMAVVAFSGCTAKRQINPPCVSACGMLLDDVGNGAMSCNELQEAEDAMLFAMNEIAKEDPRFEREFACGQLFGWQLHLSKNLVEYDSEVNGGSPYVGLSNCNTKEMTLMKADSWRDGSYPHEIFHAVQSCDPPASWGTRHPQGAGGGHGGWDEHGVYGIIEDFRKGRR